MNDIMKQIFTNAHARQQIHKNECDHSAKLATKAYYSYVDKQKSKNEQCTCHFCNTIVEYDRSGFPQSLCGYVICSDCLKPFYHGDFRERMNFLKDISMNQYLIYRDTIKFICDNKQFLNPDIVPNRFIIS